MKRNKKVMQDGITLIALIITIIVLLILAGVSISLVVGENGILTRATDAVILTEIKEIEEAARLYYMDRKLDEITGGENATIAGVISDLKAKGYDIEERANEINAITGIELSEKSINMNKNDEKELTYTLVYGEEQIRYFAEVRGKYYEINFNNGNVTVNIEEADLEETNNETEVTVNSNAENIVTAKIEENNKIVVNSLNELGEAIITLKVTSGNKTIEASCRVKVVISATGISLDKSTIIINKGNTESLIATLTPTDTTDSINWISENESIANITLDATGKIVTVTAKEVGTSKITVTCGSKTAYCTVTVKDTTLLGEVKSNPADFYGRKVKGYTSSNGISDWRIFYADDDNVFLITSDYVESSKLPLQACCMVSFGGDYRVGWEADAFPASLADVSCAGKFSPITSETAEWEWNDSPNLNELCISQVLDTKKWKAFLDKNGKGEMAIGTPTLNMWVASWNTKYPSAKIYSNSSGRSGFGVGMEQYPSTNEVNLNGVNGLAVEHINDMYFPYLYGVRDLDSDEVCWGYYLASPASTGNRRDAYCVSHSAYIYADENNWDWWAFRPVVCLKSSVSWITQNADGTVMLK